DPQLMIFTCATITTVLNLWTIRKYSKCFELEIFMYIASGFYLVTMNGIRQCLAAAILFWATKYIIEGKFIKYLITVIAMSTIHGTALVMIPIYFIVRCEAWSKTTMQIIVIAAVALICFQPLMTKFFEEAEGTKYEAYETTMATEGGANPIRTVIAAVPVVAAYIYRDKIKKEWAESDIFVNMSLICLIISVFSMINWIFNRFNIYFQTYSFILLPYIVKNCFEEKQKKLIYFGFIACFFIFFYYDHVIAMNINYTSDFINF
ncbi:MAG: EpsG family protein, partial [Paraclostridium sp.]